jgi:hypothetical protein
MEKIIPFHYLDRSEDNLWELNSISRGIRRDVDLRLSLLERSVAIKHPGFQEEKEWRLIKRQFGSLHSVLFRPMKSSGGPLIPYLEISWERLDHCPIDRITLGPMQNQEIAADRLRKFIALLPEHMKKIEVDLSCVPYRN